MHIKILGPGCANCVNLEKNTREALAVLGMEATVEKVTDYADIAGYGVMRTPGLVVDEQVVAVRSGAPSPPRSPSCSPAADRGPRGRLEGVCHEVPGGQPPVPVLHRQGRRRQDVAGVRDGGPPGRARGAACCWSRPTRPPTWARCSTSRSATGSPRSSASPGWTPSRSTPKRRPSSTANGSSVPCAAGCRPARSRRITEQLSGSCTTEIASFNEFTGFLADADGHAVLRPRGVRHRADRAHHPAAATARRLDRLHRRRRRRVLPGADVGARQAPRPVRPRRRSPHRPDPDPARAGGPAAGHLARRGRTHGRPNWPRSASTPPTSW